MDHAPSVALGGGSAPHTECILVWRAGLLCVP